MLQYSDLRIALSQFPTGVTVVTTTDAASLPVGVTVNSFASVSLEPPLVLFCLYRDGRALQHLLANGIFAVNVLSAAQQPLSRHFATAARRDWAYIDFYKSESGCPILSDALAWFNCDYEADYDAGDHVIILGRVRSYRYREDRRPLIFFRRNYHALLDSQKWLTSIPLTSRP